MDPNAETLNTTGPEFKFEDLSDDQLMSMNTPAHLAGPAVVDEEPVTPASTTPVVVDESKPDGEEVPAGGAAAETKDETQPEGGIANPLADDKTPVTSTEPPVEPAKVEKTEAEKPKVVSGTLEYTPEVGKALYDALLGQPIRANGKEIKLQSTDEAVKLVQMGLNYTKKMQTLQPALRVVTMLENNNLMDEGKLSFLIDLDKGNPQAIQKLITEKGFNSLEVDEEKAAGYVPTDHRVSEAEVRISSVLAEVATSETGQALITDIARQWDADSKQALYANPDLLSTIADQKATGLYDQINDEVERLRALGQIPQHVPFLQAYNAIGAMLMDQGRLGPKRDQAATEPTVVVPEVPAETRVVAPTPKVANTQQAQATAPVKTAPASAQPQSVNYLAMSDEAFLKEAASRRY